MVTNDLANAVTRDSDAMRRRILDALGRMILRGGLKTVGVNSLAREARCDKVLIYRYFGDLEGVHADFAESCDFWWTVDELTRGIEPQRVPLAAALQTILRRHAQALRSRPITLAVLAAELIERTPIVIALEEVRERRALELNAWLAERFAFPPSVDFEALATLLGVAVNYLAVRGRTLRVMGGVKIQSDDDWERLFGATDLLIAGALHLG